MKKHLQLLLLLFTSSFISEINAQIFFTETFEGAMEANGIPAGWSETSAPFSIDGIWNVNTSANASSTFLTYPAPATGTRFAFSNDDACNCDKSADRLIMPAQNFTGMVGVNLIFNGYLNGGYGETAVVQVSTNGGTTWTTVSPLLGDPTAWQNNLLVNLTAYAGQANVLISFLYSDNNTWGYGIGIDEVRLEQLAALLPEVGITSVNPGQYTAIPTGQVTPFSVGATVNNSGSAAAGNVTLTTNIFKLPNLGSPVYTGTASTANLAAGASATINLPAAFSPAAPVGGEYVFQHVISGNTGSVTSNDTSLYSVFISDSTYARDDANVTVALGINGLGNTGTLGNTYDITSNGVLSSVLFATNGVGGGPAIGDSTQVLIYATTAGVPTGVPIASSAFFIYTALDTGAVVRTIAINGTAGLPVTAGTKIFVGIKEFPSTDNLGILMADGIWTPNTSFCSIDAGAWTPLEGFGFPNPVVIRPNILQICNLSTTSIVSNSTCTSADGSATTTPANGIAPFVYAWSDGSSSATANNLVAGNYTVTITDNLGCVLTDSITVNSNSSTITTAPPTTTFSNCGGATGSASVNPTNGTAPYSYSWNTGVVTQTIVDVPAGAYSVTITDANGCVGSVSGIIVTNPNSPTTSISTVSALACNGDSTGLAVVDVTVGTAPYTYLWSDGQISATASNLPAGNYQVTVTDGALCSSTSSITITEPTALTSTADLTDIGCNGDSTGAINLSVTGGTAGYSFVWDNGASTEDLTGLSAGLYSAEITDLNGCSLTVGPLTVSEPDSISFTLTTSDVTVAGGTDGAIDLTVSGGTSPYTYLWNNSETTEDLSGLPAGTYICTITDANGCTSEVTVTILDGVASLANNNTGMGVISLFPNPATEEVTLSFDLTQNSDITIEVVSTTGQVLLVMNDVDVLNTNYILNVSEWSTGVYFVKVKTTDGMNSIRFVKK